MAKGLFVKESVTSALNACSWQSGRINEGMTPEQCHPVYCNSQQVEGSAGWDRYSSNDLYDQQMDDQDGGSRRIYNQRDHTKRERSQFERHPKALAVKYQKRRRRTHPRMKPNDRLLPLLYAFDGPAP